MSFEPIEPTFGQASPTDISRVVTMRRIKKLTLMSTACNVGGTVCFIRSDAQRRTSWLSRLLQLVPPESLSDSVAVFGLDGSVLNALKRDTDFVNAVVHLLKAGTRLTLQNNQLALSVGNEYVKKSQPELSFSLGIAAKRIEALGVHSLNECIDLVQLARPYRRYLFAAVVIFAICLALIKPSLAPFTMALSSAVLGAPLLIVVAGILLPWHLRKGPLGGAIVANAAMSAVIGSFALASSVAMVTNTWLGEKLETPEDAYIAGTVVVTHGRHTSCWLRADHPASNLVAGQSLWRLPLQCGEVHYRADPESHLYDVAVNPGLLHVPFIQSVRKLDDQ